MTPTRALATPLATQFGPLTNSSGSKSAPLSPLQTQFGPLGTVHRPASKFTLVSKFSAQLGPLTPRHTLVIKYTDLKGQGTPESENSRPSSVH